MSKPYFYCLECGYIGTKEFPHLCDHKKFKQIENYESEFHKHFSYLDEDSEKFQFKGCEDYIYDNTKFKAEFVIDSDTEQLVAVLCPTKSGYNKPRRGIVEVFKNLVQFGIQVIVYDGPETGDLDEDHRLIKCLNEIASRCKTMFTVEDDKKNDLYFLNFFSGQDLPMNILPTLPQSYKSSEKHDLLELVSKDNSAIFTFERGDDGWIKVKDTFKLI